MPYVLSDHTADIAIDVTAKDEAQALLEAARGMIDVITDGATFEPDATRTIEVESLDREDRMVRFLNEVLYLATSEGFLVTGGTLDLGEHGLAGALEGKADAHDLCATELKAVTYHDLVLRETDEGIAARVVIDI